jgi:phosphatidylserine decarboxylase
MVERGNHAGAGDGVDAQAIRFFNRYSGRIEEEKVYGDGFLRWSYQTAAGQLSVHALAKRALFSRWYGWRMSKPWSRRKVAPFIEQFSIDAEEFAEPPEAFPSFNAFFYRKLKPAVRPVDRSESTVVFPADGRHLAVPKLGDERGFFVKGQRFSLEGLLGSAARAERYSGGTLVLSRLCPVDYHRFHFPVSGQAGEPAWLGRHLFSVNPIALAKKLDYLWRNKRVLTEIETGRFGRVAMLEVGATCVGTIRHTATLPGTVDKGDEKGFFAFGGSAVILVFEPGAVLLADDLLEWSPQGVEVYARFGDKLGSARANP